MLIRKSIALTGVGLFFTISALGGSGQAYASTDWPPAENGMIETGVSMADGHAAEFIVEVGFQGFRPAGSHDSLTGQLRALKTRLKMGVSVVDGDASVPTFEFDFVPLSVSVGLPIFEFLRADFFPLSLSQSQRLDEKTNLTVDVIAGRLNLPLGRPIEQTELEDALVMVVASLGAKALGATYVDYLNENPSFKGFHVGDVSGELSAMLILADIGPSFLSFSVSVGGEAGLSVGGSAGRISVRSELEHYLAMRFNLGQVVQLFSKAGVRRIGESASGHDVTVREFILGAKFYF